MLDSSGCFPVFIALEKSSKLVFTAESVIAEVVEVTRLLVG